MPGRYVPERGDVVWLEFDPQTGTQALGEQAGRRPALVISPKVYNGKVGLALFCRVTSRVKGYPFEVTFPTGSKVEDAVLSDQLESLDWRRCRAKRFARAPESVLEEVLGKIQTLVGT